jgi:hypothetical protein
MQFTFGHLPVLLFGKSLLLGRAFEVRNDLGSVMCISGAIRSETACELLGLLRHVYEVYLPEEQIRKHSCLVLYREGKKKVEWGRSEPRAAKRSR